MTTAKPAPKTLGKHGRALWREITGTYELRADEVRLLAAAAGELDVIDRLEHELAGADLVVRGAQGQPAPHPCLPELRMHRVALAGLLKQLRLPDEDSELSQENVSAAARRAARARWDNRGANRGA